MLETDPYWQNQVFKNSFSPYRTYRFTAGITLIPPLSQKNLCHIARAASSRCILVLFFGIRQCFATTVSHSTVRGSVRNCQINKRRLRNSAKNYKYTSKYLANLCTAIGNTAMVSVRYQLPLGFLFVFLYVCVWGGEVPRDVKSYSRGSCMLKSFQKHQSSPWSPKWSAVGSSFLWNTVNDMSDYTASRLRRTVLLHCHGCNDLRYYKFIEMFWFIWVACKSQSALFLGLLIFYFFVLNRCVDCS